MSEIIQHAGMVFVIKGNDIVPVPMNKSLLSGNIESPGVQNLQNLLDDGYELAMTDNKKANELVQKNFTRGNPSMSIALDDFVGSKIANTVRGLGGKIPGALGILDILGMKKEYEQLMEGTHPLSSVFAEAGLLGPEAKASTQVFKDGGYVSTNPIVEDIFDID